MYTRILKIDEFSDVPPQGMFTIQSNHTPNPNFVSKYDEVAKKQTYITNYSSSLFVLNNKNVVNYC